MPELTPAPLETPDVEPSPEHMVTLQKHLPNQTMADTQVYLGVRLAVAAFVPAVTDAGALQSLKMGPMNLQIVLAALGAALASSTPYSRPMAASPYSDAASAGAPKI